MFHPDLATPTTGALRAPRFTMACSDGKIFLYARSPVAPKKTSASEWEFVTIVSSSHFGLGVGFFDVSAELISHRGQELVGKISFSPRAESLVKGAGENRHRYRFVDRSLDRPPSFAGIRDMAGKLRQTWVLQQRVGRQVEQPGCDHASAAPYFRDVTQVQVVLVVLGVTQRSSLSI